MKDGKSAPELEKLLTHLKNTRGFDFTAYKRSTLSRRIEKRLVGIDSYSGYLDYLEFTRMNRRGRQIRLDVQCVSIGGTEHGKGVIILMQELGARPAPTRQ